MESPWWWWRGRGEGTCVRERIKCTEANNITNWVTILEYKVLNKTVWSCASSESEWRTKHLNLLCASCLINQNDLRYWLASLAIFGSVHWLYIQADATGSWRSGLRAGVSKQVHHSSRAYSALPHQPCACHVGGGAARCKVGLRPSRKYRRSSCTCSRRRLAEARQVTAWRRPPCFDCFQLSRTVSTFPVGRLQRMDIVAGSHGCLTPRPTTTTDHAGLLSRREGLVVVIVR